MAHSTPPEGIAILVGQLFGSMTRITSAGQKVLSEDRDSMRSEITSIVQDSTGVVYHTDHGNLYRTSDSEIIFSRSDHNKNFALMWNGSLHLARSDCLDVQVLDEDFDTVIDLDARHLYLGRFRIAAYDEDHLAVPLQHFWFNIVDRDLRVKHTIGWEDELSWTDIKRHGGEVYVSTEGNNIYVLRDGKSELVYSLKADAPIQRPSGDSRGAADPVFMERRYINKFDLHENQVYLSLGGSRYGSELIVHLDMESGETTLLGEIPKMVTALKVVRDF